MSRRIPGAPVPLTVRIGGRHVTREVSGVTIRREAIGGVRSVALRLFRPLDRFGAEVQPLQQVTVFDGRSAAVVAQGRLADPGRSVGNDDGQVWQMVAFGPAQHASDKTFPYVVIDRSLTDGWRRVDNVTKGATVSVTTAPDDGADSAPEGFVMQFPEGLTVAANSRVTMRYERIREAGMKLGGYGYTRDCGITSSDYQIQAVTRTDGTTGENANSNNFSTTAGSSSASVGGAFPNGRNTVDLRIFRSAASWSIPDDAAWGAFTNVFVRALLFSADGTEYTVGGAYATDYLFADSVVGDLLGRVLTQFDGANAVIDSSAAHEIDQLVYPDGVTAEQVLGDLMALEPAFYWTTGPDTGNGYAFAWQTWPTLVRYEATLDDGGSFPTSTQNLFTSVLVRWRRPNGQVASTIRTGACPILDAEGIERQAVLDLGDEVGSIAGAERAGDDFLAEHRVPKNSGTLTIARPIRDLWTGRLVDPFEIEPAHLIRVRGIESYPDALNASSSDGQTVFRIWAATYTSESNSVSLELDSDSRTTSNALAALMKRRNRKR